MLIEPLLTRSLTAAFLAFLLLLTAPRHAMAETEQPDCSSVPKATLTGVEAERNWSIVEQWVWKKLREGKVADLNALYKAEPSSLVNDPRWTSHSECRNVSSDFIVQLLTDKKLTSELPFHGVRIEGAVITGDLDLNGALVAPSLWIRKSRIEGSMLFSNSEFKQSMFLDDDNVQGEILGTYATVAQNYYMRGTRVAKNLDLRGAVLANIFVERSGVTGPVVLGNIRVAGNVVLEKTLFFSDLILSGSTIGGQLTTVGSQVNGDVSLEGANIGATIHLDRTKFGSSVAMRAIKAGSDIFLGKSEFRLDLDLSEAQVAGQLTLSATKIGKKLLIDSAKISGSLYIDSGSHVYDQTRLTGCDIAGQLSLITAIFDGDVAADGLKVRNGVLIRGSRFKNALDLPASTIDGALDLSGSLFDGRVDLSSTTLHGPFIIGAYSGRDMTWGLKGMLQLQNATFDSWQDSGTLTDASQLKHWPRSAKLFLDGFTYLRIGGPILDSGDLSVFRSSSYFKEWLALTPRYSPQPYQQLAALFRSLGDSDKANAILFAGRERFRSETNWWQWLGLTILKITTGYGIGHGYLLALPWVALLTTTGAIVLYRWSRLANDEGVLWCIQASLDEMLPLVNLKHEHADAIAEIPTKLRSVLYVQKILAYVLGTCVAAGVVGLTQGQ